jgi:four helix bundle protein
MGKEDKGMGKPHKKLNVWQVSMQLAKEVYQTTRSFPSEEKVGLVSQMRRSAVSIPSNIAEGAARQGKKEFKNFLSIAGSLE